MAKKFEKGRKSREILTCHVTSSLSCRLKVHDHAADGALGLLPRNWLDLTLVSVVFLATAGMLGTQIVLVDVLTDPASLLSARILIEAEMDPAIDARVVDVSGDLLELVVLERHACDGWRRHRDGLRSPAEDTLDHLASALLKVAWADG